MSEVMTPELADYRARCFVNGAARHAKSGKIEPITANFHERFLSHPWVRDSITEGWDRELRMHLTRVVKQRFMGGEAVSDIESLMPDRKWVENARNDAQRYRKAADWRKDNRPNTMSAEGMLRRFGIGHDPQTGEIA